MERTHNLKEYRQKIADLHAEGYSSVAIGLKLNRDHSTILYHLKEMGLKAKTLIIIQREVKKYEPFLILKGMETKFENVETNYQKEKLNNGKTYAEYLDVERNQKYNKLLRGKLSPINISK